MPLSIQYLQVPSPFPGFCGFDLDFLCLSVDRLCHVWVVLPQVGVWSDSVFLHRCSFWANFSDWRDPRIHSSFDTLRGSRGIWFKDEDDGDLWCVCVCVLVRDATVIYPLNRGRVILWPFFWFHHSVRRRREILEKWVGRWRHVLLPLIGHF